MGLSYSQVFRLTVTYLGLGSLSIFLSLTGGSLDWGMGPLSLFLRLRGPTSYWGPISFPWSDEGLPQTGASISFPQHDGGPLSDWGLDLFSGD